VAEQMKEGMDYLGRRYKAKKFIAYFQAFSNTYGSVELLKEKYDEALINENVTGLAIGTRPDCINDETLELLENYKKQGYMIWLEIGLQSVNNKTLEFINRGHTYEDFLYALLRTKEKKLSVCVHIIFGLPGENLKDMLKTVEELSKLPVDGIKIHSLYITKNTPLEKLYREGKYIPITQEEYVDTVCEAIAKLPKNVVIQRLTGDPKKKELVAPDWTLNKSETLRLIEERLEKKDLWQGKFNLTLSH